MPLDISRLNEGAVMIADRLTRINYTLPVRLASLERIKSAWPIEKPETIPIIPELRSLNVNGSAYFRFTFETRSSRSYISLKARRLRATTDNYNAYKRENYCKKRIFHINLESINDFNYPVSGK